MSADPVVYLDSSALVKLVVREPESAALRSYLRSTPNRVSSTLARVEVLRAVLPQGAGARIRARQVLERTSLLALDDTLLDAAGSLDLPGLRSVDAIHLAAAEVVGGQHPQRDDLDVGFGGPAQDLGDLVSAALMTMSGRCPRDLRPAPVSIQDDADMAGHLAVYAQLVR